MFLSPAGGAPWLAHRDLVVRPIDAHPERPDECLP